MEMKRLVDENATLLSQEVAVETLLQETAERKRVDAIDKEKRKDLRAYRAQLNREAKIQKDVDDKRKGYSWECRKCNKISH